MKKKITKKDIDRTRKLVSQIRSIQKTREKKFISKDIKKRPAEELIKNKGETKRKLYSTGSKVEAGVDVALTKITSKLGKLAKKKIKTRKVLRKSKTSYKMPDRPIQNVFNDENRFFKGAINNGML